MGLVAHLPLAAPELVHDAAYAGTAAVGRLAPAVASCRSAAVLRLDRQWLEVGLLPLGYAWLMALAGADPARARPGGRPCLPSSRHGAAAAGGLVL